MFDCNASTFLVTHLFFCVFTLPYFYEITSDALTRRRPMRPGANYNFEI